MTEMTRGLGPGSLNVRCSKEDGSRMVIRVVFIGCLWMVAIPPPRQSGRGLSM